MIILFNIYINDLHLVPNICSLESYADDSKLYCFQYKTLTLLLDSWPKIKVGSLPGTVLIVFETKLLLLGTRQMLRKIRDDIPVTLLGKQILFPLLRT